MYCLVASNQELTATATPWYYLLPRLTVIVQARWVRHETGQCYRKHVLAVPVEYSKTSDRAVTTIVLIRHTHVKDGNDIA